jgi:hypothetical protein
MILADSESCPTKKKRGLDESLDAGWTSRCVSFGIIIDGKDHDEDEEALL